MIRLALLSTLVLMLVVSCGCGQASGSKLEAPADDVMSQRIRLLTGLLEQELQRQGKDIDRAVAAAPSGENNSVFDLQGQVLTSPAGVRLNWTEQLTGDYDQNSEVGAPDLQPLALYLGESVEYDAPTLHDGIARWPAGDPLAAGALNWRKARVDGDSNTEIGTADIVPIAQHFGESISGYRVYRQAPGEGAFSLLPDPVNTGSPMTISRTLAEFTASTPVRYTFSDTTATATGVYRYRIAPYDSISGAEGTLSVEITVDTGAASINADITADPQIGRAPLNVNFDAGGSTATAGITQYEWDWEGDGTYDETGTSPTTTHSYTNLGTYQPTVRITDGTSETDTASVQVEVVSNIPPTASFNANPQGGSPPVDVSFDASASTDTDGSITQYEWDYDGDFTFDHTSATPTANHQYTVDGEYTVTLRVTDNEGATDTATTQISIATVNDPPEAVLQANPHSGAPPLKVTFFSSSSSDTDGTIVGRDYDWDGDGTYEEVGNDEVVQFTYNDEGVYHPVLRVTDNLGATDTDTLTITVSTGPLPPTADLQVSVTEGDPTLNVEMDASGSTSATGTITQYEWDWEGDGTYDETGTLPTTSHAYTEPGYYSPTVRVTDNSLLTDEDTKNVTVHGWSFVIVDTSGQNGEFHSMAIVNGHPAFAYYCFGAGLRYCRSTDELGGNWPESIDLDGGTAENFYSGQYPSLQVVDGMPAIGYCDVTNGHERLKYIRANDATGSAWPASPQVLATADVENSVMRIVSGSPAIAYRDNDSSSMKYIRASDASGSSWAAPITVQSSNDPGAAIEFEIISGNPAIAFHGSGNGGLYYIRASDAMGSSWPGSPVSIDTSDVCGRTMGLFIVNGNPALVYSWRHIEIGNTYEKVYYIRATDSTGGAWGSRLLLNTPPPAALYADVNLTVSGGLPIAGYTSKLNGGKVFLQEATDQNGSGWGSLEEISNSIGTNVTILTLAVVNGKLAVAYFDSAESHLTFGVKL